MTERFTCALYAPPLAGDGARALAALHGLEGVFPDMRLAWDIMDDGAVVAIPERDQWVLARTTDGGIPLLCNGDETFAVSISGSEISGFDTPGGHPLLHVHATFPLDGKVVAAAADILAGIGDAARAFGGVASPLNTSAEIAQQTIHRRFSSYPRDPPPRGLPELNLPDELSLPEIPDRLGWLNYWSPAAATAVGFPDPARDAELLARARRTAGGAWIVRLTDGPLDLDIPAHLNALRSAYERFPAIGGRDR